MDNRFQLLKHLYGEKLDPEALKALLADPELQKEFSHLEEVRHVLASGKGRQQPHAPEAAVTRILDATAPRPSRIYVGRMRRPRPRRIMMLAGGLTAAAAIVALFVLGSQPRDDEPELSDTGQQTISEAPDTTLTWDDTDDFIQLRQTLSVVRQRTSPQLWDESAVMTLDSIPDNPAGTLPGLQTVSTGPRNP